MAPEQLNETTRLQPEPLSVAGLARRERTVLGKTRSRVDCVKPLVDGIPV